VELLLVAPVVPTLIVFTNNKAYVSVTRTNVSLIFYAYRKVSVTRIWAEEREIPTSWLTGDQITAVSHPFWSCTDVIFNATLTQTEIVLRVDWLFPQDSLLAQATVATVDVINYAMKKW